MTGAGDQASPRDGPPAPPSALGRALDALGESEAWNRAFVAAIVDAVITIDRSGSILTFNPAASRLFGYEPAEVVGSNVSCLMPPPHRTDHDAYIGRYVTTGEKRIIGIGREVRGLRKDGTTFPLHLSVSEVRVGPAVRFVGILRDLTHQNRLQEELTRSRTLAAVGEMSASLAHEIKNPLAGIRAAMQNLRRHCPEDDPGHRILLEAINQVDRLDETVRHLLLFSRSWNPRKRVCELREIVDRVLAAIEGVAEFGKISIRVEDSGGVRADVDRAMVEQVVLNLLLNSAQAMHDGGGVLISLGGRGEGPWITVVDDGPGIPGDVQASLFKPFFTTKSAGTGLGLLNCLKIVEAHGGAIALDSRPGEGTRVTLRFPPPG